MPIATKLSGYVNHTLRDLLAIGPCSTGIDQDIVWAVARLGYLDTVVEIARYASWEAYNSHLGPTSVRAASSVAYANAAANYAAYSAGGGAVACDVARSAIKAIVCTTDYPVIQTRIHNKLMELINEQIK